jgi:head-tail adaptor
MITADSLKNHVAIGAMDRRITVRSLGTPVYNDLDEVTSYTNTDTTVYAHVMNEDVPETDVNDKETVIERRVFVIRYMTLTYENQIVYNSNVYDITRIEEIGRRRFLKVMTKRVV